jgi:hypothetical protein
VEEREVYLDPEHLLHAADVRPPDFLEGIEERAGPLDAGGRIDNLVAVDPAAPALHLVLRPEGKLLGRASDLA